MGGHSCYEGGHRAHGGLGPPRGKTLTPIVLLSLDFRALAALVNVVTERMKCVKVYDLNEQSTTMDDTAKRGG